jgi:regulator of sigma E protease
VTVRRDGTERTFALTPIYDAQRRATRLGFGFAVDHRDVGPLEAARLSTSFMWTFTGQTVDAIAGAFVDADKREELSGVVGSYEVTRQTISRGVTRTLQVLALISLSLGVINLFPFLPLDGGHIFWAVAEKVRGRPIPFAVMERAGLVGFVLVIALFMIGLTNDIGTLAGEGFDVR